MLMHISSPVRRPLKNPRRSSLRISQPVVSKLLLDFPPSRPDGERVARLIHRRQLWAGS